MIREADLSRGGASIDVHTRPVLRPLCAQVPGTPTPFASVILTGARSCTHVVAEASQEDAEAAARSSSTAVRHTSTHGSNNAGEAGVDGSTKHGSSQHRSAETSDTAVKCTSNRGSSQRRSSAKSETAVRCRSTAASGARGILVAGDAEREVFAPATTVNRGYVADEVVWSRMGPHPFDQRNGGRFFT